MHVHVQCINWVRKVLSYCLILIDFLFWNDDIVRFVFCLNKWTLQWPEICLAYMYLPYMYCMYMYVKDYVINILQKSKIPRTPPPPKKKKQNKTHTKTIRRFCLWEWLNWFFLNLSAFEGEGEGGKWGLICKNILDPFLYTIMWHLLYQLVLNQFNFDLRYAGIKQHL